MNHHHGIHLASRQPLMHWRSTEWLVHGVLKLSHTHGQLLGGSTVHVREACSQAVVSSPILVPHA